MILQRLRDETRAQHARLESRMKLTDPSLSRDDYAGILKRFLSFYWGVEEPLARTLAREPVEGLLFEPRRRATLLLNDLHSLGARDELATLFACPPQALPILESSAHALGCLFVLEESTMDSHLISRSLDRHLRIDATNGASFFEGYGQRTGDMWKSFVQALETYAERNPESCGEISRAAVDCIEKFESWVLGAMEALTAEREGVF